MTSQNHVWWPKIDQDIHAFQEVKQASPVAPLQPWIWPSQPWKRIHVDFAGPFMGGSYLIAVGSKWPEVHYMSYTTASKTIQVLRSIFARYGIPEQLVSENGPQFVTLHAQHERGKVIGCGVHIYIYICLWTEKIFELYFRDRLTFSNIRSRTSRRIYRLALPLRAPETLAQFHR